MNAVEIKNMVEAAAGEIADSEVAGYLDGSFLPMNVMDGNLIRIMENKSIRDKVGTFADVLWNDEGFLGDHLGNYVYQIDNDEGRKNLLEGLSKVSSPSHDSWHNVLAKIEKELISA